MQTGGDDQTPAMGSPVPASSSPPPAADTGDGAATGSAADPVLPAGAARQSPPTTDPVVPAPHRSPTWYRSDRDRHRSVRRRANPWYRQLLRYLVALIMLGALGAGLYFGARAAQDYLDRDQLPSAGADVPEIRSTSFQVRSSSPAPEVDGTLTIDTASGAFQFIGRNGGPQDGIEVVSPSRSTLYVRTAGNDWAALSGDQASGINGNDLRRVVDYLSDDDTADAILPNRLRRGYVDLIERATEGEGDDQLTRYELELDTVGFSDDYPAQWHDFENEAIPGVQEARPLPVVIWLDAEDVLVRVRDEQTSWSWERLTYSDVPFSPQDPASTLLEVTTDSVPESDG